MAPDETGACYLYEFLAAHRRWKLHVTLNDEKTFFILRLFPGRNALVFDPRYLHAAAQIATRKRSVKSGALFVGRRRKVCAQKWLFPHWKFLHHSEKRCIPPFPSSFRFCIAAKQSCKKPPQA